MTRWRRSIFIGIVVGSCIGCDQASKIAAQEHLAGREPLSFLGGILRLSYVENPGGFLSLGASFPTQARFWVFGVSTALILAVLAAGAIARRSAGVVQVLGTAMILGGGIGNLVDRVDAGVVRDFVNVGIGSIRTGVFNVADVAITAGAALLLCSWRGRPPRPSRRET